jgi:type III secretory pathway component EscT
VLQENALKILNVVLEIYVILGFVIKGNAVQMLNVLLEIYVIMEYVRKVNVHLTKIVMD